MGKHRFTKRNLKVFSLFFFSLFFLFSILSNVSATSWFFIPTQSMNYNQVNTINLNNYCSVTSGISCAWSYYQVSFTNPDNGNVVTLNAGQGQQTSEFSINLNTQGILSINSFSTSLNMPIAVYGKGLGDANSVSTTFSLYIAGNVAPLQIGSFAPVTIYGNGTKYYDMNSFFQNYNQIQVNFNDPVLGRSVSLTSLIGGSSTYSTGAISVTLIPASNDISLVITGLNQSYNSSSFGGNTFNVIASNAFGSTNGNSFSVTTYPTVTSGTVNYNALPIRNPISIAPLYFSPNQSIYFDFNTIYQNYSYINMTFDSTKGNYTNYFPGSNATSFEVMYTNGSTIDCFWWNMSPAFPPQNSTYCNYNNIATLSPSFPQYTMQFAGLVENLELYATTIPNYVKFWDYSILPNNATGIANLSACNNIGCRNVDAFGNPDNIQFIQTVGNPPNSLPFSYNGNMGLNSIKFFDLNRLFSNYNNITINWSDGGNNYSLSTPASGMVSQVVTSSGTPIYQVNLFSTGIMQVISANTPDTFTVYFNACNYAGCIPGGFVGQPTMIVVDIAQSVDYVPGITNSGVNAITNTWLGLYPDASTLNSAQKTEWIILTMFLFTALILFFSYKAGADMKIPIYIAMIFDAILFMFFAFIGYVSATILLIIVILGALFLFLKFKGGSE